MIEQPGGCLCGAVRYHATAAPLRVTVCHCRFCQRTTGSAFMVEPIFRQADFAVTAGSPKTYVATSAGSGKQVTVHFCATCGGRLFLSFERFPDAVGVFAGGFDEPNWFPRTAQNTRHIFTGGAQHGVVLPAGCALYPEHALRNDGTPNEPFVLAEPRVVGPE